MEGAFIVCKKNEKARPVPYIYNIPVFRIFYIIVSQRINQARMAMGDLADSCLNSGAESRFLFDIQ
jgi:hypothetical protein